MVSTSGTRGVFSLSWTLHFQSWYSELKQVGYIPAIRVLEAFRKQIPWAPVSFSQCSHCRTKVCFAKHWMEQPSLVMFCVTSMTPAVIYANFAAKEIQENIGFGRAQLSMLKNQNFQQTSCNWWTGCQHVWRKQDGQFPVKHMMNGGDTWLNFNMGHLDPSNVSGWMAWDGWIFSQVEAAVSLQMKKSGLPHGRYAVQIQMWRCKTVIIIAGVLPGLLQSAFGAELYAVYQAISWAVCYGCKNRLWTDCQGVVTKLQGLLAGMWKPQTNWNHFDLWERISDLIAVLTPASCTITKVAAHQSVTLSDSPLETWAYLRKSQHA